MTGFARHDGTAGAAAWHWEVRSVNNRGLDLRLRLPPGYDTLEPLVREMVAKRVTRGSVIVNLRAERQAGEAQVRLNETALNQAIKAAERVRGIVGGEPPRAEGLLALKGVLEVIEEPEDEAETAKLHDLMLKGFAVALDGMVAAREAEGRRLKSVLEAQVAEIERLVQLVEASPGRRPEAIKARLADLVARLTDSAVGLDPQRLHQEAVLVATRADVEEELKRLHAHIGAARDLLAEDGAIGRKLDFLAQEFNREANTLTSKAGDADISRHGLSLKAVIDQLREQVQNIE
jgi:uncharacterized protein (TIGR00255 family)